MIRIIPVTKYPGCFQFLSFILNDMDSPKCNDATKESGVFLWMHFILFNDTKRCLGPWPSLLTLGRADASIALLSLNRNLVALTDSINLMTTQRTVEI